MKTIRFQISDEDHAILSAIADRWYQSVTRGDGSKPGIEELAEMALLSKRKDMLFVINQNQPWSPPANAIPGPWKPVNCGKVEA